MSGTSPLGATSSGPDGWLVSPGAPFGERVWLENTGRSKVMIGPNGYGKSRLLRAMRGTATSRAFRSLPLRMHLYAALAQEEITDVRTDVSALRAATDQEALRAFDHDVWQERAGDLDEPFWLVGRPLSAGVAAVDLIDRSKDWRSRWSFAVPAEQAH